jgi:hypothetical protein
LSAVGIVGGVDRERLWNQFSISVITRVSNDLMPHESGWTSFWTGNPRRCYTFSAKPMTAMYSQIHAATTIVVAVVQISAIAAFRAFSEPRTTTWLTLRPTILVVAIKAARKGGRNVLSRALLDGGLLNQLARSQRLLLSNRSSGTPKQAGQRSSCQS